MTAGPSRMSEDTANPAPLPVQRLRRPTATRLRSSLVVPSIAQVLNELVQNALDAGAQRIECWINLVSGNETVRVEDDGDGVRLEDLDQVGERNVTSKEVYEMGGMADTYGFRGEALASIAALSLVEFTTRVAGGPSNSKIIKNSKTLYQGAARTDLSRPHGTTVTVRNLFNAIPVRQAAMASSTSSSLSACKRVIESLALARPQVRWTLWEERPGGARKVVSIQGGKTALDVFRMLYGNAGVEKVQKVRVSAGDRRADGFISLEGAATKGHQHLHVNGYPLESSELQLAIAKRFANSQFSTMATDLMDDAAMGKKRPSPRRLERHPVYVLSLTVPSHEVDAMYEPRKSTLGYRDGAKIQSFVVAVVDDFLRRNGFGPRREATLSPGPSPRKRAAANNGSPLSRAHKRRATSEQPPSATGKSRLWDDLLAAVPEGLSPKPQPDPFAQPCSDWINKLVNQVDDGVLVIPSRRRSAAPVLGDEEPTSLTGATPMVGPPTDITFPRTSLAVPLILAQVDRKFVPCVLDADPAADGQPRSALVVFDQHAADERAAVESILDTLCEGFATSNMATSELPEDHVRLVLTRKEVEVLEREGVRDVLERWGVHLAPTESVETDYVQVGVVKVPSLLDRLARKEGTELTRLLRLYLPVLADDIGELQALIISLESESGGELGEGGWARVQRWMPREMVELANSKACRGAIMFEDRLDNDQCHRLLTRLATTRNPWVCAHGRPTFIPLCTLPTSSASRPASRQRIDWASWNETS